MRNIIIAPGEHYHIFNRGNNKQMIFLNDGDRARFLFNILCFQSSTLISNLYREFEKALPSSKNKNEQHRVLRISEDLKNTVITDRFVELENFTLMPNHFHLTVHELEENGIARYMQRLLNGYTKYFNTKYKKSGHLFQGPYKAVHISHDRQLLYLSAYIHRNPKELQKWSSNTMEYPWSSYQDYTKENRWNELLQHDIITDRFSKRKEYKEFVETSGAKEFSNILNEKHLLL